MSQELQQPARLAHPDNCAVCGKPLSYETSPLHLVCAYCGQSHSSLIYCPDGHYVCDSCHQGQALAILRQVVDSYRTACPAEITERVMSHPSVPMHGPEHHAIVPAAIVAAVRNAGYPIRDGAIEEALTRGSKVPGGWCGLYGACGAGVGVGVAVSILSGATPLTGGPRALANEATSFALSRMIDGHPRCCKRASRKALGAAVEFLRERMGITLDPASPVVCRYVARNKECPGEACPYYP